LFTYFVNLAGSGTPGLRGVQPAQSATAAEAAVNIASPDQSAIEDRNALVPAHIAEAI
jgi:hypothetical protein